MNNNSSILRKDIFSGKTIDRNEMIRIVKNKNNDIFIDESNNAHGRGVYLVPTIEAFEKIKKTNQISRSLKCKVSSDIYNELEEKIRKINESE